MVKEERFRDISANPVNAIFPPKESLKIFQKHSIENIPPANKLSNN
jgi:hypothetical protein